MDLEFSRNGFPVLAIYSAAGYSTCDSSFHCAAMTIELDLADLYPSIISATVKEMVKTSILNLLSSTRVLNNIRALYYNAYHMKGN